MFNWLKKFQSTPEEAKQVPHINEMSYYVSPMYEKSYLNPYNPDDLYQKKGNYDLYEKMMIDDQIKAVLSFKKLALLSPGFEITPASQDNVDVEAAEFIKYNFIEHLKGSISTSIYEILSAFSYGISVTEKMYTYFEDGPFKGKIGLDKLKNKPPHGFYFNLDDFGNVKEFYQETTTGKITLPQDKFIIYSYNAEFGNPYGKSDLRECYRSWFSKDAIIKFWNIYLERYGMPTAMGTYPAGQKGLKSDLDTVLKNLQAKTAITKPEGTNIELLEASRAGVAGYERAVGLHNMMMARALLVPDLLGLSQEITGGSRALGTEQFKSFYMVLQKVAGEIEEQIIFEQVIKPLVDINFIVKAYPRFKFKPMVEKDRNELLKLWAELVKANITTTQREDEDKIRTILEMPELAKDKESIADKPKPEMILPGQIPPKEEDDPDNAKPKKEPLKQLFKLRRQSNKYEQKMDFPRIASMVSDTGQEAIDDLESLIVRMEDSVVEQIKKNKYADFKDIENLSLKYWGDFRLLLKDNFRKVFKQGNTHAREVVKNYKAAYAAKRAGAGLDFTSALEFFDQKSWQITGLEKTRLESEVKTVLQNALKNGWSTKETIADIQRVFKPYLFTPQEPELAEEPWKLETIVRTNFMGAFNMGMNAEWADNKFVEAYEWSAILDDRTSDYCEVMDGKIFTKDTPGLSLPPAHFNCRSVIVPIMADEQYTISILNPEKPNGIERQFD